METVAMYLPQFHRVKENDEWWGEGFTEWTAVKQATPLFEGHKQPRIPLNNNYYDLLDKNTLYWQAELAQKYDVSGFCFYHYYFENGKKILEKPVEEFCRQKDIDIKFCLCWANETWARSWEKLGQYNSWADKYEKQEKNKKNILLQQSYGRESEWEKHFYYLLPFFKDERYIRNKNDEIIFLIYRPRDIYCLADMTELWNKMAKKEGIGKICFIGLNIHEKMTGIDAILINGPSGYMSNSSKNVIGEVNTYGYSEVWQQALNAEEISGIKTYFGGFQNFDNTPRRGDKGSVLVGATPQIFQDYFRKLVNKNYASGNEFTFINAWNEWGEGMYLEPDTEDKYEYLEAISAVMSEERVQKLNVKSNCIDYNKSLYEEKYYRYYQLLNKWMHIRDENREVISYFNRHNFEYIAIYGIGGMGQHLISELKNSNIKIEYIIDKDKSMKFLEIECKNMNDELKEVDAVIVTPTFYYDEIRENLKKKLQCPIISLEEVIEESLY